MDLAKIISFGFIVLITAAFLYVMYLIIVAMNKSSITRPVLNLPTHYVEALLWLTQPDNILAGNRFDDKREAIGYVQKLYTAGASKVELLLDGNTYSDTLIVHLPIQPAKRRQLFELINMEYEAEAGVNLIDKGQDRVELWWD